MKHNNDTMSLAVYLVVEKPNNHVQRTLSLMHAEEPIVCVKKQRILSQAIKRARNLALLSFIAKNED